MGCWLRPLAMVFSLLALVACRGLETRRLVLPSVTSDEVAEILRDRARLLGGDTRARAELSSVLDRLEDRVLSCHSGPVDWDALIEMGVTLTLQERNEDAAELLIEVLEAVVVEERVTLPTMLTTYCLAWLARATQCESRYTAFLRIAKRAQPFVDRSCALYAYAMEKARIAWRATSALPVPAWIWRHASARAPQPMPR